MTQYSKNIRSLAKSWNNLDIQYMKDEVSDTIVYGSYWNGGIINGKETFLSYMNAKFSALKFAQSFKTISVNAELVKWKDEPYVFLSQITEESIREVLISVHSVKDRMQHIWVNEVPDDREQIVLSGDIPM